MKRVYLVVLGDGAVRIAWSQNLVAKIAFVEVGVQAWWLSATGLVHCVYQGVGVQEQVQVRRPNVMSATVGLTASK